MEKPVKRNKIIDTMLSENKTTVEIIAAVQEKFPEVEVSAVKRHIYTRRSVLKKRLASTVTQ